MKVSSVKIIEGGEGYLTVPSVSFGVSNGVGSGAAATAVIKDGKVTEIKVDEGGAGYTQPPNVSIVGDSGHLAVATAVMAD